MAGSIGMLTVVDSTAEVVESSGEGLPPEQKPCGRLYSVVSHEDWGKGYIFDLEPEPEPEPLPPPREKKKSFRRSMLMQPKASEIYKDLLKKDEKKSSEDKETFEEKEAPEEKDASGEYDDEIECWWSLPFLLSSMMATTLENTITSLRILGECNNFLRISKAIVDMPLLLPLKYDVKILEKKEELQGIDPENFGCLENKLNKLQTDRTSMLTILCLLYFELSTEKSFITIIDFVNAVYEREEYAAHIKEEEATNRILRRELAKKLRIQRNQRKTVAYDVEMLVTSLKSQVEDAGFVTETKGRYVDNWQLSRTEQHEQLIFETEDALTNSTQYYKQKADNESRVHSEIEHLINIIIHDTLQSIDDWMDKYEIDTEKLDLAIQIQKHEYLNVRDKRVEMENLYAKREKDMKAWIKFKEEREKERQYAINMNKSAIIVQAWWRGLLVRKQLGPFRKRKGRKKK